MRRAGGGGAARREAWRRDKAGSSAGSDPRRRGGGREGGGRGWEGGEALTALCPRRSHVLDGRPACAWSAREGVKGLKLTVFGANDRCLWTRPLPDGSGELPYPPDQPPLAAGRHNWEVSGTK